MDLCTYGTGLGFKDGSMYVGYRYRGVVAGLGFACVLCRNFVCVLCRTLFYALCRTLFYCVK